MSANGSGEGGKRLFNPTSSAGERKDGKRPPSVKGGEWNNDFLPGMNKIKKSRKTPRLGGERKLRAQFGRKRHGCRALVRVRKEKTGEK